MKPRRIGIRWTIGDVSPAGFEALRLSIWGAARLFGPEVAMAVCVNSVSVHEAKACTGLVPAQVQWREAGDLPEFLRNRLDRGMAEGVAWKFAPLRVFPDCYELSLDNDCVLWALPDAVAAWLDEDDPRCVIAADAVLAHGAFTRLTRPEPRNTGIRGFPPGYDLGAALHAVLDEHDVPLRSELDEQGLQVVALDRGHPACVVSTADVSICSPFWPHRPVLGRAGAHFIALNARALPWSYYERPASEWVQENWQRHRQELYARIELAMPLKSDVAV